MQIPQDHLKRLASDTEIHHSRIDTIREQVALLHEEIEIHTIAIRLSEAEDLRAELADLKNRANELRLSELADAWKSGASRLPVCVDLEPSLIPATSSRDDYVFELSRNCGQYKVVFFWDSGAGFGMRQVDNT
jgi:hypothetical protein